MEIEKQIQRRQKGDITGNRAVKLSRLVDQNGRSNIYCDPEKDQKYLRKVNGKKVTVDLLFLCTENVLN